VRYVLVAGDRDRRYLAEAQSFAVQLDGLRVPHRLLVLHGAHDGTVWRSGLVHGLEQVRGDVGDTAA
jgi:enterochelin esterase-like enzyme